MDTTWFTDFKDWEDEYTIKGDYHFNLKGFNKWWFLRNYRMLCKNIKPNAKILDLGCGDGVLGKFCISSALFGNDISEEALKYAEKTGRYKELYKQDISNFKIEPNTFDHVISSLTLQYLDKNELSSCVSSVHKELKSGGLFVFSYPNIKINNQKLIDIMVAGGFEIDGISGICLRMPKFLYKISYIPILKIISYCYYVISLLVTNRPYSSYHYVVYSHKK